MKKVLGVIGYSGSGKSTFVNFLKELDVYIIDADKEAREVMEKGSPCLKEAVNYFGEIILNEDGTLNRKKLAQIVFNDEKKVKKLNSITWDKIVDNIINKVNGTDKNVLIDCVLLTKTKLKDICDEIIFVKGVNLENRIMKRDGISLELAKSRLNSQGDDLEKDATIVVTNDGNLEEFKNKVMKIYREVF